MSIWIIGGIVVGAWALLNTIGGDQMLRLQDAERRVKAMKPAAPPDATAGPPGTPSR